MRQILTPVLAFHWMAVFALLATLGTALPGDTMPSIFSMHGVQVSVDAVSAAGSDAVSALFSIIFSLVAALFLWTIVTALFGERAFPGASEEVARLAFGSACVALTLLMMAGAVLPTPGIFPVVAVNLAALAGSYLAVAAERWALVIWAEPDGSDVRAAARVMAAGAAHNSMLSRLSGRPDTHTGGGRR